LGSDFVQLVEVSARDGLQKASAIVPTEIKLRFLHELGKAGFQIIELTKLRSPKFKQFDDAEAVIRQVVRLPGVHYPVLVSDDDAVRDALALGVGDVGFWVGTTDAFNQKSLKLTLAEARTWCQRAVGRVKDRGAWVRAYVSAAFGCPVAGAVAVETTAGLARDLFNAGVDQICLADTAAAAGPGAVAPLVRAVAAEVPRERLSLHFHDTRGMALANALAGHAAGVRSFDGSVGGIGGENLASEELLAALESMGVVAGIRLEPAYQAVRSMAAAGVGAPGRLMAAGVFDPGARVS
jgi:hydroxymethylglutaryl-CoA lyase